MCLFPSCTVHFLYVLSAVCVSCAPCHSSTLTVCVYFQNPNILLLLNRLFTAVYIQIDLIQWKLVSPYNCMYKVMKRFLTKSKGCRDVCLAMKKSATAISKFHPFPCDKSFNMCKSNLRRQFCLPFREEGNVILITPRRLHVSLPGLVPRVFNQLITTLDEDKVLNERLPLKLERFANFFERDRSTLECIIKEDMYFRY